MTTTSKSYSSASNAKRAAKSASTKLDAGQTLSEVFQLPDGGWVFETITAKPAKAVEKAHTEALENGELVGGEGEAAVPLLRKSLITNPVEWSWNYFDSLLKADQDGGAPLSRKFAIAGAVASGIAFYTARTQYQSWKTANKI